MKPPKTVFVVVSPAGPQFVGKKRKSAVDAARRIWAQTEVYKYTLAVRPAAKGRAK